MKKIFDKMTHHHNITKRHWVIISIILFCVVAMSVINTIKNSQNIGHGFAKHKISKELREEMLAKNIWNSDCPIPVERLRLLTIPYYNFAGKEVMDGKMVVLDVAADRVLKVFKVLHANHFPIASIKMITEFDGDDYKSIEANNTSAFNCRKIATPGSNELSIHSYGLAIDVNPLQNPYIENEYEVGKLSMKIYPAAGMQYMNRINIRPGMVENVVIEDRNLSVVDIFKINGFKIWGGSWDSPLDWHHFQVEREFAKKLAITSPEEGVKLFESFTSSPNAKSETLDTNE